MLGYHDAFFACFLLFLIPLVVAFFINDKKAEAALSRRVAPVPEPQSSG